MSKKLKDNEFKCVVCGEVFTKGWTEEEAINEKNEIFGNVPIKECDQVCDDCFNDLNIDDNKQYIEHLKSVFGYE